MLNRILRAIKLDPTLYREVAEDRSSMSQAIIIVIAVTFLSALGGAIGMLFAEATAGQAFLSFFTNWLVGIVIGWLGWAILTYFIGTMLFQGKTDMAEMARVLGFASSPRLLGILGVIPCVGWIASLAGAILALIAGVIAIREAMEFDTGKAIITVLIGWVIVVVISLLLGGLVGGGMALFSGLGG